MIVGGDGWWVMVMLILPSGSQDSNGKEEVLCQLIM